MMRSHKLVRMGLLIGLLAGALWLSRSTAAREQPAAAAPNPNSAAGGDQGALFTAFVPGLRHPRCMNCHSNGDLPRQGDDAHSHAMNVRRGPEGQGVTAEKCSTCHQDHNLVGAHLPPGAPNWGLPPARTPMIWQGLTDSQSCEPLKDPEQNKNRNIEQLFEHLTDDKLVTWGWNPGDGRTPVPMPHDEFASKVSAWQAAAASCP